MFSHFLKRALEIKRLSVRTISCHGVNRIRNHDYSSTDWYALTGQAIGISRPIIVFVMVTDIRLHPSPEFCDRPRKVGTPNGMSLHQHALFRRKPACFAK